MNVLDEIRQMVTESDLFSSLDQEIGAHDPLHFDSMSLIWLITKLEERYAIQIDYRTEDLTNFESMHSISTYIDLRLRGVET
ncbi:hypothetical protein MH117_16045 [Paenibacillus sp. ACRRX]|uniref:hypothetical protein n=1 Tax=unclassified Paenibacillus TaxID=185978 RepID=UPI001EF67B9C|nr:MULTISPECIES: hypothetical protein [unclassified Paenibacillus]MCG7408930.1 hypothetical protein [Paenibacillus sp. ACRRX]MDK8182159.1 hypothetical protein [Paenibacillus sp. UMB4589-SE434]